MFENIDNPGDFLEFLIRDTWAHKIDWDSFNFDYGKRYLSIIPIKNTSKYFKIEVFEMGTSSFVKTYLHLDSSNNISFDNIKAKDGHRERIVRLALSIKRIEDENQNIFKNY